VKEVQFVVPLVVPEATPVGARSRGGCGGAVQSSKTLVPVFHLSPNVTDAFVMIMFFCPMSLFTLMTCLIMA
jgi:hypothetical protein